MTERKITISCTDREKDLHIFDIDYDGVALAIDCYLQIVDNILVLESVNVEGPGSNYFGRELLAVINGVCREFCKKYGTKEIIIIGSRRAVGKTKGKFLNPIHKKYSNL